MFQMIWTIALHERLIKMVDNFYRKTTANISVNGLLTNKIKLDEV